MSELLDNGTEEKKYDTCYDNLTENIEANIHSNDYSPDSSNANQEDVHNPQAYIIKLTLSKGYSSHKYCFDCRTKDKNMVILKSNPRYEITNSQKLVYSLLKVPDCVVRI